MIPEIGHFALILALVVALVQATVPLAGAARGNAGWMALAPVASVTQFLLIAAAFGALTYAYVVSDFTVLNVVQNSHSDKPLFYRIAGVWGNHEGSMLLWVLILSLFGALIGLFGNALPPALRARALAVQGMIGVGFLLFILGTSNPFLRVFPPPLDGNGMNPILQDPSLAIHPPFLYFGYVGFSMAFSFAVAALIEGRVDPAWARWVRPWTLAAWCGLTVGIAIGSWWSYYSLGWGGWWFWDPVENASLMPWLSGTALLHSAIVVEKRGALKTWTILLAILTFSLSLVGTFLVRSGVLSSVHAFAVDPERGVFILALLVVTIGSSLSLYAIRAPSLKAGGLFAPISREGGLVLNNLLLSTACATVFIGTLYPLFLNAIGAGTVSVGAPYYAVTFVPLMLPLIAAVAIGPMLAWKRGDLAGALGRLKFAALVAAAAVLAALTIAGRGPVLALVGVALGTWVIAGAVAELAERIGLGRMAPADSLRRAAWLPRSAWGMAIAHAGLGIAILGMVASTAWSAELIRLIRPGETASIAGYQIRFDGVQTRQGPNYVARYGTFPVSRDGRPVTVLHPQNRWFPLAQTTKTEAAIHTTGLADLYLTLGDAKADGAWTIRAYYHPLVPLIWLGAIVMALGGLTSLSDRRLRVGAPRRGRAAALQAAE